MSLKKPLRTVLLVATAVFLSDLSASAQETPTTQPSTTQVPAIKTPTEKAHLPVIRVPDIVEEGELFFVGIQIGEEEHEMTEKHRIEWIDGSLDGKPLFHITLSPLFAEPRINIPLRINHVSTLKVEAHCSVHGTWGREVQIHTKMAEPAA